MKPEGLLEDRNTYPWYLRVTGVAAALLPSVAGAGHVVFEDNGEAAYLVDAATLRILPLSRRKSKCWAARSRWP